MARTVRQERTERNIEVQLTQDDLVRLMTIAHDNGEPDITDYPDDQSTDLRVSMLDGVIRIQWKEIETHG